MRIPRIIVSGIVALSIASAAYAQEALKGEVVTVDEASKKIAIKLSGTVGSSDATAPTDDLADAGGNYSLVISFIIITPSSRSAVNETLSPGFTTFNIRAS